MAFSSDSDLTDIVPDILTFGISTFADEHNKADADIKREIRAKWWSRTGNKGEMDASLLTGSQWTRAAAYLVLAKYALPQLTNWVEGDRFKNMMDFYNAEFLKEMNAIFEDGVEYDLNEDGTVEDGEKNLFITGRLSR